MDPNESWAIIDLALRGIIIVPLILIWLFSLCLVRRKGDHARLTFFYLKAAFPSYILALVLYVGLDADYIALVILEAQWGFAENIYNVVDYPPNRETNLLLSQVMDRLGDVGGLLQRIGDILLLLCLVELGNGLLYCLTRTRTSPQKIARFASVAICIVVFALALASLGLSTVQHSKYYDNQAAQVSDFNYTSHEWYLSGPTFDEASYEKGLKTSLNVQISNDFVTFAASLALVAYATYALHRVRADPRLKSSAVLFLVSTIIMLVHFVWSIALDGAYFIPSYGSVLPHGIANVADPILGDWTYLITLILLFVVGLRKQKGLWSDSPAQPEMGMLSAHMQPSSVYEPQYMSPPHELRGEYPAQGWTVSTYEPAPLYSSTSPRGEMEQPGIVHEMK